MAEKTSPEDVLDQNPLVKFSLYTDVQVRTLNSTGEEVLAYIDKRVEVDDGGVVCSGEVVSRGYGQFWLWLLGAYEVVRTMCQAQECFAPPTARKLERLKHQLAALRMPFAKQELQGNSDKPKSVDAEPSIHAITGSPSDLVFEVKGKEISARALIREFEAVVGSISRDDIRAHHQTQYRSTRV